MPFHLGGKQYWLRAGLRKGEREQPWKLVLSCGQAVVPVATSIRVYDAPILAPPPKARETARCGHYEAIFHHWPIAGETFVSAL